ncbi:MAG: 23S rRNA (pseudouridine(1915)-N(3))-methyltransferase RlmH [Bacteroidales bacterium]|nr:23S rRNA (pseudouridine(1915)-N(3))-methyltransferase RlmH [Bacteroidales bacterium]
MKITLINIGKTNEQFLSEGISKYEKRIQHYISFEIIYLFEKKNAKARDEKEQKDLEGKQIIKYIEKGDYIILLDEHGKQYSSVDFAGAVQHQLNKGIKNLVFIIGGAFGFSDEIYRLAHEKISLSLMTFSHQLVRLIFVEQLYRAFTILKGEPYHHK